MKRLSKLLAASALSLAAAFGAQAQEADSRGPSGDGVDNALLYAVAWKQTAAEYRALYHQGFNIARLHVEAAIAGRRDGDRPLAVVTDVDDTILQPLAYWGHLVAGNRDYFDDPIWDRWIPTNGVVAAPGARAFLDFCSENGVEVFYITSRDQGEKTYDYARGHLRHLGYPYADDDHLTVLRDTSNKEKKQDEILAQFDVVVFLGDSLNDFRRRYYLKGDVDGRIAAMEADRALFGMKYVVFPNPDGRSQDPHVLRAIAAPGAGGGSWKPASPPRSRTLPQRRRSPTGL